MVAKGFVEFENRKLRLIDKQKQTLKKKCAISSLVISDRILSSNHGIKISEEGRNENFGYSWNKAESFQLSAIV